MGVLATVRGVELIHAGSWDISTGPWEPTPGDLVEAVAALDCPAVRRPILKLGHTDPRFDGEPTLGFIANLAVDASGQALVGDYVGIPSWLAETDEEGRSILASAYPDRSVEGAYDLTCQLGHVHPFVLTGVALLGVTPPGVGTLASLNDVAALYGVAASADAREPRSTGRLVAARLNAKGDPMPAPTPVAASASVQDIRRAYYDGPAKDHWSWWITDIFIGTDGNYLFVMDDDTEDVLRVGFTVTGDVVAFDDPVVGHMEWHPNTVAAAAGRPSTPRAAVSYGTREQSRPGQAPAAATAAPQTPAEPPADTNTPNPEGADTMSDTLLQGLRERLGVSAELDEAGLLAALDESLNERADAPAAASTPAPLPEGTVVIDSAQLEELRVAAQAGHAAREQQLADRRVALVDAAIGDGRIAPVRRDHWLASLKADAGNEQVLAGLAPGLVPVAAMGHDSAEGTITDPAAGDDYWFGGSSAPATQEG